MGLDANMKAGVAAAGATRLKVPQSANYAFTSSAIKLNGKPLDLHTASNKALIDLRAECKGAKSDSPQDMWDWAKGMAAGAVKAHIGNCGEIAAVALTELVALGVKEPLEYVYVLDGVTMNAVVPHVIAVIGRPGGAKQDDVGHDIGLPSTWGPDAVVCDAWDRVVYPAALCDVFWDGLKKHSTAPDSLTCMLVAYVV